MKQVSSYERFLKEFFSFLIGGLVGMISSVVGVYIICLLFMPKNLYIPDISEEAIATYIQNESSLLTCSEDPNTFDSLMKYPLDIKNYYAPRVINLKSFTNAECQWIMREGKKLQLSSGEIKHTKKADHSSTKSVLDQSIRSAVGAGIHKGDSKWSWIMERILSEINEANERYWQYKIPNNPLSDLVENIQFQVYHASQRGHYNWHQDTGIRGPLSRRTLSAVVILSDLTEYEGGELQIKSKNGLLSFDKRQGAVVLFPSYMLHQVTTVTKGTRCALAIWIQSPLSMK